MWRAIASQAVAAQPAQEGLFGRPWPQDLPDATVELAAISAGLLREDGASPHQILTFVYEQSLRLRPELHPGTARFSLRPVRDRRKSSGSFYTPPAVARAVVEATHVAAGNPAAPAIVDPAMGTGVFLLQAVDVLAGDGDRARIAETCTVGYDLDPIAVDLAVLGIWLETGARLPLLQENLRMGDLLLDPEPGRFDLVVGNPPWGLTSSEAHPPGSAAKPADSFKLFLHLALRQTRGAVGMVVPQAMLLQQTHADVRAALLRQLDPYCVIWLGDGAFPDAAAPACALIFGPKPGPRHIAHVAGADRSSSDRIRAHRWTPQGFPLAPDALLDLLDRLRRRHPTLGQLRHVYRVRDVGINYNRATVARRVLYDGPHPEDPRDLGRFRGRGFGRYTAITPDGWLRHDALHRLLPEERFSLGWSTCALPEKIVVRQTSDRIVATLDRTGLAMGRSVIAITAEADVSLPALLACLNSRLVTVLYRALSGEEGRLLPQVKVARLLALPIPSTDDRRVHWDELRTLAESMLAADGRDDQLDQAIDRLVCETYGLTSEEIALIAPA
jgi:hypothetical protein